MKKILFISVLLFSCGRHNKPQITYIDNIITKYDTITDYSFGGVDTIYSTTPCDSFTVLVRKYDSVRVDFEYINMIIDLVTKGSVFLDVDRMPDCFLKRVYVDEGVKYSELYFLAQEKSNKIYYCSIATTKEGSRLEKLNDRMKIELAINHLRQIFEKI